MYRTMESGFIPGTIGQIRFRLLRVLPSFWCTHHVGDLEVLKGDEVVVVDELSAQLVGGIATLILDLEMQSYDLFDLTPTTIRSSLFGRQFTLGLSEVFPTTVIFPFK